MSEEKAVSYVPQIKAAYSALLASHKKSLAHALTLGSLLNDAKEALGKKGKWTEWLAEYCPQISHRTANIYMKLAKHKDKFTDETNSQRAAIKALDGDFGVSVGIAAVNDEDNKDDSSDAENDSDQDDEEDTSDKANGSMGKTSPDDLACLMQNVGVDEVFIALRQAWEPDQLADLVKRVNAHLSTLTGEKSGYRRTALAQPSL